MATPLYCQVMPIDVFRCFATPARRHASALSLFAHATRLLLPDADAASRHFAAKALFAPCRFHAIA